MFRRIEGREEQADGPGYRVAASCSPRAGPLFESSAKFASWRFCDLWPVGPIVWRVVAVTRKALRMADGPTIDKWTLAAAARVLPASLGKAS